MSVIILRASQVSVVGIEPPVGGQVLVLVEAEVPLAHSVGPVARLPQFVCQCRAVPGQGVGLGGPDDAVLQSWAKSEFVHGPFDTLTLNS